MSPSTDVYFIFPMQKFYSFHTVNFPILSVRAILSSLKKNVNYFAGKGKYSEVTKKDL